MDYSIAVYSYIDASITSRLQAILKRTLSQSNFLQTATRLICLGEIGFCGCLITLRRLIRSAGNVEHRMRLERRRMHDPIATCDRISVQWNALISRIQPWIIQARTVISKSTGYLSVPVLSRGERFSNQKSKTDITADG